MMRLRPWRIRLVMVSRNPTLSNEVRWPFRSTRETGPCCRIEAENCTQFAPWQRAILLRFGALRHIAIGGTRMGDSLAKHNTKTAAPALGDTYPHNLEFSR